jgi:uncharacterized protein DUF2628
MPVFTVHAPVVATSAKTDADSFVFVRDGFHFWAFLLGPLWLLWHRLWLTCLAYLVIIAGIAAAMFWLRTGADTRFVVALLVAALTGYEAASLQRLSLSQGRWRELGVVVADDEEAAERRFFARWTGEETQAAPPPIDRPSQPPPRGFGGPTHDVIGLFPQPGAPR